MGSRTRRNAFVGLFDVPLWRDWAAWNFVVWTIGMVAALVDPVTTTTTPDYPLVLDVIYNLAALATLGLIPPALRRLARRRWANRNARRATAAAVPPADPYVDTQAPDARTGFPPPALPSDDRPPPGAGDLAGRPTPQPDASVDPPAPPSPVRRPEPPPVRRPEPPPVAVARPGSLPDMPPDLDDIRQSYPHPIAQVARRLQVARDPKDAYESLLDLAEVLTICLGAVTAAVCRHLGQLTPALRKLHLAYVDRGLSQGHWRAVAVETRRLPLDQLAMFPGLADGLRSRPKGSGLLDQLEHMLQERNRWAHGGRPQSAAEAAVRVETLLPVVLLALRHAGFLRNCDWSLIEDSAYQRGSRTFRIRARRAMGDHPTFDRVEFDSPDPLADEVLYLRTPAGFIDLSPFIVVRHCPTCQEAETFHSDRLLPGRTVVLKSFGRGHVLHDPTMTGEIEAMMAAAESAGAG